MPHYELAVELPGVSEDKALAVAGDIAQTHGANVNVYCVALGYSFADKDKREIVQTVEP